MKKRFSRALAMLLAVVMLFTVMPVMAANNVEEGAAATFINGLPEDGTFGVIYNVDNYVFGADVADGSAPAKTANASTDGKTIPNLPNGTAIFKFIKTGSDYYLTIGGKYLTVKDLDENNKEKLVLTDEIETGAKWTFVADQGGKAGYYNIKNAEYKYNNKDVYLEVYGGAIKPWGYSKTDKNGKDQTNLYQFKFASTEPDDDGRVGDVISAGALPADGQTYVVYNYYAKAVMGQPTGADIAAPALLAAPAVLNDDWTIDYENVADGGMIFTVSVTGTGDSAVYTFESNGKFLAMPENKVVDDGDGKTHIENDETLLMIDWPEDADKQGYAQWTLKEISGGHVMYNVAARYKTSKCCIEFFNDQFSGWSYKPATPELFAMHFIPMQDKEGTGYVVNPEVVFGEADPAIGSDCPVTFKINDVSEPTAVSVQYQTLDASEAVLVTGTPEVEIVVRDGSFTVPAADLEGAALLNVTVSVTDALGKTYSGEAVSTSEWM